MYPKQTDWFLRQYEEAVRRPFGYLFVDLKPSTQDSCRLRTNVLPGEEKFDKGGKEANTSQELLQCLKQQDLMTSPVITEMQRLQNNMDKLLYRTDIGEYDKTRQYMQLQNRFLTYNRKLDSIPEGTKPVQEQTQISATPLVNGTTPLQLPVTQMTPSSPLTTVAATPTLAPSILIPPPTVEVMSPPKKRKRPRIPQLKNYLDDYAQKTFGPFRRSRRNRKDSRYKYSGTGDY